jgi:hypothetical protein
MYGSAYVNMDCLRVADYTLGICLPDSQALAVKVTETHFAGVLPPTLVSSQLTGGRYTVEGSKPSVLLRRLREKADSLRNGFAP